MLINKNDLETLHAGNFSLTYFKSIQLMAVADPDLAVFFEDWLEELTVRHLRPLKKEV